MITGLILGIAGSAVVAILYGLILGQREEQIRHYLSTQRKGLARRRYVRAFVGAVRGRAAAANTSILTILILVIPLIVAILAGAAAIQMEQQSQAIDVKLQRVNSGMGMAEGTNHQAEKDKLIALNKEWNEIKTQSSRLVIESRVIGGLGLLVFYIGWFLWRPFLVMRQRFAYEIERFTLRIQGLATKAELAELAVAEANVIDEKTLRHFVEITRGVASRHGIPQLVATFDLWKD
jgi:hypothetical protein